MRQYQNITTLKPVFIMVIIMLLTACSPKKTETQEKQTDDMAGWIKDQTQNN